MSEANQGNNPDASAIVPLKRRRGQSVYGGYLLNVRVGDTETTLRGVVFKPGLTPTNKIIPFQSQNNHKVITSPFNQNPAGGAHESEVSQMKTALMPFEKLLTEVIKHAPSQSTETNSSLAVNLPVEDSAIVGKKDASDTESVKPLQVLHSHVDSHPAVASRSSEDCKTGKMIQFLQENMTI